MNLIENIRLALAGLKTSKMRSLLTMLGIIIGIGAVIGIVTIGDSMTNQVTSSMSSLGANSIYIMLGEKQEQEAIQVGGIAIRQAATAEFLAQPTKEDMMTTDVINLVKDEFSDQIDGVGYSVLISGTGEVTEGRKKSDVTISGVNDGFKVTDQITVISGRFLEERDMLAARQVAVIADKMALNIYGTTDVLGEEVKVYIDSEVHVFTIVGIYEHITNPMMAGFTGSAGMAGDNPSTVVYIPVTTAQKITGNLDARFSMFTIAAKSGVNMDDLTSDVNRLMHRLYKKNLSFEPNAISMESILGEMDSILGTLSIAITAIAAIALLVGGIGVMNIMLVSVTERTREIGTRKALGAKQNAIRAQFIIESIILCLIGGIIGVFVGLAIGAFGASLLGSPAQPSIAAIVLAVAFSMLIGVFFGYYPANKAASLDPIEALRYE